MQFDYRAIATITMILFAVIDVVGSLPIIVDLRSKVVNVPAPAINGNAIGTIEAVFEESSLLNFNPNIISKARMNKINEPAMANDSMRPSGFR